MCEKFSHKGAVHTRSSGVSVYNSQRHGFLFERDEIAMRKIEIGQHFKKVGLNSTWKARQLVVDREGIRHFRLYDPKDPSRTILISERTLLNRRYFQRAEATQAFLKMPAAAT